MLVSSIFPVIQNIVWNFDAVLLNVYLLALKSHFLQKFAFLLYFHIPETVVWLLLQLSSGNSRIITFTQLCKTLPATIHWTKYNPDDLRLIVSFFSKKVANCIETYKITSIESLNLAFTLLRLPRLLILLNILQHKSWQAKFPP